MPDRTQPFPIYFEIGQKRIFAGAVGWPGLCRAAKTEDEAVSALFSYAPRYGRVLESAKIPFLVPKDIAELAIAERIPGNVTTDFGAPDAAPSRDSEPVSLEELEHLERILVACWSALDARCEAAVGIELRKGPRGGGRDLEGVRQHVLEGEDSYVAKLGGRTERSKLGEPLELYLARRRHGILELLAASVRGEIAAQGPRGGARWSPRFFVRRAAWHILDHVWEIEDRTDPSSL